MQVKIDLPTHRRVLANGLEVLVLPDKRAPTVTARMRYHVGSKDEAPREQGLSHYLEHLTYVRTAHTEEDSYFPQMLAVGASQINGETTYDNTDYYFSVPPSALGRALWLERERMHFALDGLSVERAARELKIVESEQRLRYTERELGAVYQRVLGALVDGAHPYAHTPIGDPAKLAALDLERDIVPYYRRHYAPNRATLVLAGDVDPEQAHALVASLFGDLPPVVRPEPPPLTTSVREDPLRLRFVARGIGSAAVLAWSLPPEDDPQLDTARTALRLLGSLVHWKVQHEDLGSQATGEVIPRRHGSAGVLELHGNADVRAERLLGVLETVQRDFENYLDTGWSGNERSHCIIGRVFELSGNEGRAQHMLDLAGYGRNDVQQQLQRCMDIKAGPVVEWATKVLVKERAVLAFVEHDDSAPPAGKEVSR